MKNNIIVLVIGLTIGAFASYFLVPTKIETKTVEIEKTIVQKDVQTITKIVERPDGTKTTEIASSDKSKEKSSDIKTATIKVATNSWHLSASYSLYQPETVKPIIGLQIEKRIAGPIFLGVRADTNKVVSLILGLEF